VPGVWALNLDYHMRTRHPAYARPSYPSGKALPLKMAEALLVHRILSSEELRGVLGSAVFDTLPPMVAWSTVEERSVAEHSQAQASQAGTA
jgi:hypothetical protein